MKRLLLLFVFAGLMLTAMADWTYGTAYFQGSQPSNCLSHGTVMIWYNGELKQTGLNGGVETIPTSGTFKIHMQTKPLRGLNERLKWKINGKALPSC